MKRSALATLAAVVLGAVVLVVGTRVTVLLTPAAALNAQSEPQPRASNTLRVLDRFDDLNGWSPHPSNGVRLDLAGTNGVSGNGMKMSFDFQGKAGYAIARKSFALGTLPANWSFSFRARGEMPPNTIEFKLLDRSGDNVWWYTVPEYHASAEWSTFSVRQRQVHFAWGPTGGGPPRDIASIEIVITAGQGSKGSLSIDDLVFNTLPPDVAASRFSNATAIGTTANSKAQFAIDGDNQTAWKTVVGKGLKGNAASNSSVHSSANNNGNRNANANNNAKNSGNRNDNANGNNAPTLTLDLGGIRTYGGIVIEWGRQQEAQSVVIDSSNNGANWNEAGRLNGVRAQRSYVPIVDGSSRYLRLRLISATHDTVAIRNISVKPLDFAATPTSLLHSVAHDAPRAQFPRAMHDEQTYWAIVGVSGGRSEALLSEDGQLEIEKRGPSLEPFLTVKGKFIAWSDVTVSQSLLDSVRPIPSVNWHSSKVSLSVTAFAAGTETNSTTYARYRIRNISAQKMSGTFWLALRPMQVNPPWQFLNTPGGAARVDSLVWNDNALRVNGALQVRPLTNGARVGTSAFDAGEIATRIASNDMPTEPRAVDPRALASAAFAWTFDLSSEDSTEFSVAIPLDGTGDALQLVASDNATTRNAIAERLSAVSAAWARDQDAVRIHLPALAPPIATAIKANLAWILINRDGPGIQPGSRSYERSWIRDGSLTAEALLRLGRGEEAKAFAEWYATFQFPSGKVPCCVDTRGADPVDEHDSQGEFIHLVYEVWRYTGDASFAKRMWPHVKLATQFLDSLRKTHLTSDYNSGRLLPYRGLLPPSISHEGYSAKPMHSYWDDGFALLGFENAAALASALNFSEDARRIGTRRDEFERDLLASLSLAMALHKISYLPGSVELGDFDATSTTTLIAPVGELPKLPRAAVESTFARYYRNANGRTRSDSVWENYTPYEWRTVGTLLRLDKKAEALSLLNQFMNDRRPKAWQQWAEVIWKNARNPKFVGDMPHTWVGSDFIRSALDLFAYDRESDSTLVVGAGLSDKWLANGDSIVVHGLRTLSGTIGYAIHSANNRITVNFDGDVRLPAGGMIVHSPRLKKASAAMVDGEPAPLLPDGTVVVRHPFKTVVFTYQ